MPFHLQVCSGKKNKKKHAVHAALHKQIKKIMIYLTQPINLIKLFLGLASSFLCCFNRFDFKNKREEKMAAVFFLKIESPIFK